MGLDRLLNYTTEEIIKFLKLAKSNDFEVCVFGAGSLGTGVGRQILKNYDIQIDYYCDNNEELQDKEVRDGIYCRSIERLIKNREKTICFLLVGGFHTVPIYRQLMALNVKYIVTYNDLLDLPSTLKQFFSFMRKNQIAIYTCITGGYDNVHEPIDILDNCDYYLISDKKPARKTIYQWIDIADIVPREITDNIIKNRYCKILPHRLFDKYRYSLYIDGNIRLKGDITECIPKLKRSRIGVMGRENVDNVYSHTLKAINIGIENPSDYEKQIERYWYQGLEDHVGMFFCGMLLREHNNPICVKLMEEWWEEYLNGVKRDQISFPYILWRNGYTMDDLLLLCGDDCREPLNESPYWELDYGHNHKRNDIWKEDARKFWTGG